MEMLSLLHPKTVKFQSTFQKTEDRDIQSNNFVTCFLRVSNMVSY